MSSKNANGETVMQIRLDEIEVNPKWNTRSNLEETAKNLEQSDGVTFDMFVKSIADEGQDTPIVVRPNKPGSKKAYFLISGNRRFEAFRRIAEKGIDPKWASTGFCKNPTIRAIVRNLSDVEAFELNIRENTEREDLTAPDLAFGIGRLCNAYRTEKVKYTQTTIADKVGYSQAYVGKLMGIVGEGRYVDGKGVKQEIFDNWRSSPVKVVTVSDMAKVAALPPADQDKAYADLCRKSADSSEGGSKTDPIKTAAKKAGEIGKVLGVLVREGALDVELDSEWWLENINLMVKIKNRTGKKGGSKPPTEGQIAKVAKAGEKSYCDTLVETDESETDDDAPKGKKSKNGAMHAEN